MGGIVAKYKKNPIVRRLATAIVQYLPGKDWVGEIGSCFNYVRNNIRYVQDINEIELLQTPLATLKLSHGDCDDMCMLLSSLLESIGFQTKFVAIGFEPQVFDHVYLEVLIPSSDNWIACDPTEPNELGWSADGYCCRMEFLN